jgi:hypothetical protein
MRYLMIVKANRDYEAGVPPKPELMAAVGKMAEEMYQTGRMIDTGGLLPSSQGTRVNVQGGRLKVVDGPFTETKELVGGYAIMEVASREEAIELGKRFMQLHADVMGPTYEGELEIRPLAGMEQPAQAKSA